MTKRTARFGLLAVAVFLCLCSTARAQSSSPESVAGSYAEALESQDWATVGELTHSSTLERSKQIAVRASRGPRGARFLEEIEVQSTATLEAMDPAAVFEKIMTDAILPPSDSSFADFFASNAKVIGSVSEGDSLVHVVRRVDRKQDPAYLSGKGSSTDILTLKDENGNWRVNENQDVSIVIDFLAKAFSAGQGGGNEQTGEGSTAKSPPSFVEYERDCTLSSDEDFVLYINGERHGTVAGGGLPDSIDPASVEQADAFMCEDLVDKPTIKGVVVVSTE